jgi:2-polyprenyl-6-methoxyphenol hydroxylase-like FAD-dependent oxidoreductase
MVEIRRTQCCIVGGGPAGMVLGYLLGRAGVKTLVLEKHADFLRDFRGDTVHPSTLRIMRELGLLEEFLQLFHSEIRPLAASINGERYQIADFGRLPPPCNFIALMPQWDFLEFLVRKSRHYASLQVLMSTQATALIEDDERRQVTGVVAKGTHGPFEIHADLVVGCDGRSSTVRKAAGLSVTDSGAPIDVLWFRLSKQPSDPEQVLGHLGNGKMFVTIDRTEYWQCAYVIRKGGIEQVRAAGLEAFRNAISQCAPFLKERMLEIQSVDDIKLLSVSVDHLETWSRPGLLCIGDAAHAMSPVGGVGINLAVQDAVATANLLASKLKQGTVRGEDLARVRKRRLWPVLMIQRLQITIHNRVLSRVVSGDERPLRVPRLLKVIDRYPWLQRWPAQLLGVGIRPEHVRSPTVHREQP